jgi:hypothetical protein
MQDQRPQHREIVLGSTPISVARKLSTIEDKAKIFQFVEEVTRTKVTNRKTALCSSPGEDWFRDFFFL